MKERSAAVLGLDGLFWAYFEKLAKAAVIPFLHGFFEKAMRATLRATIPSTYPSWTSIMTGVNPGKHGIFSFSYYDRSSWRQFLCTALDLEHPRIHEVLSMEGFKSIVFNPIPDYPLLPVKRSTILCNLFFNPKPSSHPPTAYKRYFPSLDTSAYLKRLECEVLESYIAILKAYEHAIEVAIREEPLLLWVTLNIPDVLFHECPPIIEDLGSVKPLEAKIFQTVDRMARKMAEHFEIFAIVSDHGFATFRRAISLNDILLKAGFAKATSQKQVCQFIGDYWAKKGYRNHKRRMRVEVPPSLYHLAKKLGFKPLAKFLSKTYFKISGKSLRFVVSTVVDVEKSLAFHPFPASYGVFVKEPAARLKVVEVLRRYVPRIEVHLREELYNGPFLSRGPDIVVLPNYDASYRLLGSNIVGAVEVSGTFFGHHPDGVFMARGLEDSLASLPKVIPPHAVAPILLHAMGLSIPKDSDAIPLLDRRFLHSPRFKSYAHRWQLFKRIVRVSSHTRQSS